MTLDYFLSALSPSARALPRFTSLAEAVLHQVLDLYTLAASIPAAFSLDSATGVQLDTLASSLGLSRADTIPGTDADDETFRSYIRAKLALWRWDGTNETIPAVLAEAFPDLDIRLEDNCDLSVTLYGSDISALPAAPETLLPVPAGIRLITS